MSNHPIEILKRLPTSKWNPVWRNIMLLPMLFWMSGCCVWGPAIPATEWQWVRTGFTFQSLQSAKNECTDKGNEIRRQFMISHNLKGPYLFTLPSGRVQDCKLMPDGKIDRENGESCVDIEPKLQAPNDGFTACMKQNGFEEKAVSAPLCPSMKVF